MIQERIVTLRVHCGVKTCNMLDGSGRQCMYIEPISKRAAKAFGSNYLCQVFRDVIHQAGPNLLRCDGCLRADTENASKSNPDLSGLLSEAQGVIREYAPGFDVLLSDIDSALSTQPASGRDK